MSELTFEAAFSRMPLIAILRGLKPTEAEPIGEALLSAGFTLIETPLNSPDPFDSIARLNTHLAGRAIIGAGTVLSVQAVDQCAQAGARFIVAPNMNTSVVARARALGMKALPGVVTPTEAFAALDAGADALKLFPGELVSPAAVRAMRAVLPTSVKVLVVGGVDVGTMGAYRQAGADGFGMGGALFKPGMAPIDVEKRAERFCAEWARLNQGGGG